MIINELNFLMQYGRKPENQKRNTTCLVCRPDTQISGINLRLHSHSNIMDQFEIALTLKYQGSI